MNAIPHRATGLKKGLIRLRLPSLLLLLESNNCSFNLSMMREHIISERSSLLQSELLWIQNMCARL